MLRVATYENEQMQAAIAACSAWLASDPRSFADYSGRVHDHSMKLPPLVASAQQAIAQAGGYPPTTRGYFMGLEYAKLVAWRSALTVLYREWLANPHGCTLPAFDRTPQPTAPDPGLDVLRATQPVADAMKAAKQAATWSFTNVPPIAVLLLAYLLVRELKA